VLNEQSSEASQAIIAAASASRAVVIQSAAIGSWVLPGESLATIRWTDGAGGEAADRLAATVREAFRLGKQRTNVQDVGFPIRQLADIALKGLSPGSNDPTTAQNAIEQLTTILVEFARQPRTSPVRVDEDGTPRFVAMPPDLDQLTRLGFGEVRICARGQAELSRRLVELLEHLRRIAGEEGCSVLEIDRQRDLIVAGLGADGPTAADFADAGLDAGS